MNAGYRGSVQEQSARFVARVHMRVPEPGMRSHLESMIEDALRTTTLPGEEQGRVYFFRTLRLPPVPERAVSMEWVRQCSRHLLEVSQTAKYGCDDNAGQAAAVYFNEADEPQRHLLSRLLRGDDAREWYWHSATNVPCDLARDIRLEQVLEQWHVQPASWAGVARELLPLLDRESGGNLLHALTLGSARRWLQDLESAGGAREGAEPRLPMLRASRRNLLHELANEYAVDDARLLFLTVLVVLESCPGVAQDASLVRTAVRILEGIRVSSLAARDIRGRLLHVDAERHRKQRSADVIALANKDKLQPDVYTPATPGGLRTEFAGLYFLLHPLRHVGIAGALEANPQLAVTQFVSRVLLRLAGKARVAEKDPVLFSLADDLGHERHEFDDALVIPDTMCGVKRLKDKTDVTERLWTAAVRRWCRKHAQMSAHQICARPGRIVTTRTHVEIIMPMSSVDLRIRRCGLDLDPGYVPWLGRVVRFHYHVEAQR